MTRFENILYKAHKDPINLLDTAHHLNTYVALDLSVNNAEIANIDITDPFKCQAYMDPILEKNNAKVAYGGYLEKRNLYKEHDGFGSTEKEERNIHLGIDLWAEEGTKVFTPLEGRIHSFKNNATKGDYGPTIVLEHLLKKEVFYTLYGHLSLDSLQDLVVGKFFKKGEELGSLGHPSINVNYAPHLHFQIIRNMDSNSGDYPGVCSQEKEAYYIKNCPNPNYLLKIDSSNID